MLVAGRDFPHIEIGLASGGTRSMLGEVACSSDTLAGKSAAAIMGRGLNGIRVSSSSSSSKGVREHQLGSGQIWGVHDYTRDEGRQRLSLLACSSANTEVEEACLLVIATSPHYSEWSPNPTLVKKSMWSSPPFPCLPWTLQHSDLLLSTFWSSARGGHCLWRMMGLWTLERKSLGWSKEGFRGNKEKGR